jgi:hypothetical protein
MHVREPAGAKTPNAVVTLTKFSAQFPTLVLAQRVPPRKPESIHILLISAAVAFDLGRDYSEAEVNSMLQHWVDEFGARCGLDHVTMRRLLIDEGYLRRDAAGRRYASNSRGFRFRYDPMIRTLDLHGLIEKAEKERDARKAARGIMQDTAHESTRERDAT